MADAHNRLWRDTEQTRQLRRQVIARAGGRCELQGPTCTGRASEVDHVVAISERPDLRFDPANCRAACRACNARAGGILGAQRKADRAREKFHADRMAEYADWTSPEFGEECVRLGRWSRNWNTGRT